MALSYACTSESYKGFKYTGLTPESLGEGHKQY